MIFWIVSKVRFLGIVEIAEIVEMVFYAVMTTMTVAANSIRF